MKLNAIIVSCIIGYITASDSNNIRKLKTLTECQVDCDKDADCAFGLLCADAHKQELKKIGKDERKAYCGNVGAWNEEVCYDPMKLIPFQPPFPPPISTLLYECQTDCDKDTDCVFGLLCAETHKAELITLGYDQRKAYCGNVGGPTDEVCYNPTKTPPLSLLLKECEVDCDKDADCAFGLFCAQTHRPELIKLGYNQDKAYCGNVGRQYDEVCYDPNKTSQLPTLLKECEVDCDTDADCSFGLLCAQTHRSELIQLGYNPDKAYCGNVGRQDDEVCYNPTSIPQLPPFSPLLKECQFDCDKDTDCAAGLLCADAHKAELKAAGRNRRKAYCGKVGRRFDEVCYDPKKV